MAEDSAPAERRDFTISDCCHLMEQIASSLLETLDGPRRQTTQTQRDRLNKQLEAIVDSAELVTRVATRLKDRYSVI